MSVKDLLESVDVYGRTARLYPAVLLLLPLLWHLPLFGQHLLDLTIPEGLIGALISGALLYAVASMARHKGKQVLPQLIACWGALPTTALLRHRDARIERATKERYHRKLAELIGAPMPSAADERADPDLSDATYRSATRALIEARRQAQFRLLHKESAAFGFRRNLYGLRPWSIALASGLLVATLAVWWAGFGGPINVPVLAKELSAKSPWALAISLDVAYLAFFFFVVTPSFVLEAGNDYAIALLRTLDQSGA